MRPGASLWRVQGASPGAALLVLALTSSACSNSLDRPAAELDCSVADAYEFRILQNFEAVPPAAPTVPWYGYPDMTPGSEAAAAAAPIVPERCGSTGAVVLTARGNTNWGGGFGEYLTANLTPAQMDVPQVAMGEDGSAYEGVSFWARSPGHTSKGFLFNINDSNSANQAGVCVPNTPGVNMDVVVTVDSSGNYTSTSGNLPRPDQCGNDWSHAMIVTDEWQLYRVPFKSFRQSALPNRKAAGIDTSLIVQFTITPPKESLFELWLDDLGFYRPRDAQAAGEASPP